MRRFALRRFVRGAAIAGAWLLFAGCTERPPDQPQAQPAAGEGRPVEDEPITREEVQRKVREAAKATGRYLSQTKEEFERDLERKLADLDDDLARLKSKAADLKEEARPRWEEQMKRLEARREQARKKLEEVKAASPEAWQDLKTGAHSAWEDLKEGFDEASQHFESEKASD
ncbi:MAG: hypothetical protein WD847_09095 [Pirellulales bacterium]